jgi:ATP phosphoribosyltransferase regulatory subunit
MDPVSQRMLGVRADMTPQIARIAVTRLRDTPRPLRLSYAGPVLRVTGSALRPEREFGQVGAELIGSPSPRADAEVILLAVEAVSRLGVTGLTVDLGTPTLVSDVCTELGLDLGDENLKSALNHKDSTAVAALGGAAAAMLGAILAATGPADSALAALGKLDLPPAAADTCRHLAETVALVRARAPDLDLTVDAVEMRGYEYHTGPVFTLFALGVRGELGCGGRYVTDNGGESATGVTLFMDSLLRALPRPQTANRIYIPHDAAAADAARLRADGWVTVAGLDGGTGHEAEARRLACTHILTGGEAMPV